MANSSNEKVYNVLAYIGILFIVGLIADSQNPKVRFHVNQGLVLFLAEVILGIVCSIIAVSYTHLVGGLCCVTNWKSVFKIPAPCLSATA